MFSNSRKHLKYGFWGLMAVLIVLIIGTILAISQVSGFNNVDRRLTPGSQADGVTMDIHARGGSSDSWEKNDAFPDRMLYGKIYEATITNSSLSELKDWELRIDIDKECWINSAWCGTVEIHQLRDTNEMTQTLDLRDYSRDELALEYILAGQDVLISLEPGDYIIYHPTEDPTIAEMPIESSAYWSGSSNVGLIFYSDSQEDASFNYIVDYHLYRSFADSPLAAMLIIVAVVWVVAMIIYIILYLMITNYEHSLQERDQLVKETIDVFNMFIDAKDKYTQGHSDRVAEYSRLIAERMNLPADQCQNIYYAGLLHDIGKCYVPDEILKKDSGLTDEEYEIIKTHTTKGAQMLNKLTSIPNIADGAHYHHERYDGTGYPNNLRGQDIPLMARIICVADSFDTMNSTRYYKEKMDRPEILKELKKGSGTQFDPRVVEVFIKLIEEKGL